MNDEIKTKLRSTNFTVQARILHPKLFVPEAKIINGQPGKPKYSAMVVVPKQPTQSSVQQMQAFIQEMQMLLHPQLAQSAPQHLVQPLKDHDTYVRQDGKPNPEYTKGCFWLNAASGEKFQPVVVDMNRQQVLNEAEVWSGRNAAVNISFYPIMGENGGKRGLGVNLNAVMLLEGGEQVVAGGGVSADEAFGNFQADMGIMSQGGQAPAPQAPAPQAQQWPQNPAPQPQAQPNPWNPQNPAQPQQQAPQGQPNNPFNNNGNGYI